MPFSRTPQTSETLGLLYLVSDLHPRHGLQEWTPRWGVGLGFRVRSRNMYHEGYTYVYTCMCRIQGDTMFGSLYGLGLLGVWLMGLTKKLASTRGLEVLLAVPLSERLTQLRMQLVLVGPKS